MIKKATVILLSIMLLFGLAACKEQTPNPAPTFESRAYVQTQGNSAYYKLFMPDGANEKVVPSVQLVYMNDQPLYASILNALLGLDGVYRGNFRHAFDGDVTFYSAKKFENIIYINLSRDIYKYSQRRMAAGLLAIAHTFANIENIDYVSFSVEGRQLYLSGITYRPLYAISAETSNITEFLIHYQLNDNNKALNLLDNSEIAECILYFGDVSGNYVVPEVRKLLVQEFSYVDTIVDELVKGPALQNGKRAVFEEGIKRLDACQYNATTKTLTINFLAHGAYPSQDQEWAAMPALVNALSHALPDMDYMVVNIYEKDGETLLKVYDTFVKTTAYGDLVRSHFKIYLPNKDMTGLSPHTVALKADSTHNIYYSLLAAILQSTTDGMAAISQTCGLDALNILDEILYIRYNGEVLVVNITTKLHNSFFALQKQQEYLLVFSIVNTLCEASNIKSVQFIVNGYTKEYFARRIRISEPLIEAYGI